MASSSNAPTTTADPAATVIATELAALTTKSNQGSHKLCQYVLENVLLHQAAAQQLQGTATNVVNTGQQLLATSRQLNPQLQQLAGMADTAKQLRAQAEQLKQLSNAVLPQLCSSGGAQQQQQQQQQQDRDRDRDSGGE